MAHYRFNENLEVPLMEVTLEGQLAIPENAKGIIVFAHGSGSSQHSPRNQYVAKALQESGYATLLFDLLTETEDLEAARRFDIELLTKRLIDTTDWLKSKEKTADLTVGYFGASTGAAAALKAAAELGDLIGAVVSRGGRPDMASPMLSSVISPTLLLSLVGSIPRLSN